MATRTHWPGSAQTETPLYPDQQPHPQWQLPWACVRVCGAYTCMNSGECIPTHVDFVICTHISLCACPLMYALHTCQFMCISYSCVPCASLPTAHVNMSDHMYLCVCVSAFVHMPTHMCLPMCTCLLMCTLCISVSCQLICTCACVLLHMFQLICTCPMCLVCLCVQVCSCANMSSHMCPCICMCHMCTHLLTCLHIYTCWVIHVPAHMCTSLHTYQLMYSCPLTHTYEDLSKC